MKALTTTLLTAALAFATTAQAEEAKPATPAAPTAAPQGGMGGMGGMQHGQGQGMGQGMGGMQHGNGQGMQGMGNMQEMHKQMQQMQEMHKGMNMQGQGMADCPNKDDCPAHQQMQGQGGAAPAPAK